MKEKLAINKWHRKQAVDCFNSTWELIDKEDRNKDDDLEMIHLAHTSRFHWGKIGGPLEFARGEWQISRVYSILDKGEQALYYGEESLRLCIDNNIGDFDLAFGYESIARAYAVLNNSDKKDEYIKLTKDACDAIKDKGDKDYVLEELKSV